MKILETLVDAGRLTDIREYNGLCALCFICKNVVPRKKLNKNDTALSDDNNGEPLEGI